MTLTEEVKEFSDSVCIVLDYIEGNCNVNNKKEEVLSNIIKITDIFLNTTLEDEDYDILIGCSNNLKNIFNIITTNNYHLEDKLNENNQIIYMKLLEKYNKNINNYNDDLVDNYNYDYDTYKTYINDIRNNNYKELTFEEEQELGKRIKEHDKEAVHKLVTSNLKLVVGISKNFIRNDIDFMDLIEIGNEALVKAAWRFDYTKNIKFSTYATVYITGFLQRYSSLYQTGTYVNPYLTIRLNRFLRVYNGLDENFFSDRLKETIKILNISEEEANYLLTLSKGYESLNRTINNEVSEEFINTIVDSSNFEEELINKMFIKKVFNSSYLNSREKKVLKLRYGIGLDKDFKLEEVAEIIDLQPANISRIEKVALRKIRVRNRDKEYLKK